MEFGYNNAQNISNNYMLFELNYSYHLYGSYKKNIDPYFRSKSAKKLLTKLQKLMLVCYENLHHTKSFKNEPTIKAQSLKAMFLVTKFG